MSNKEKITCTFCECLNICRIIEEESTLAHTRRKEEKLKTAITYTLLFAALD